MKVQEFRCALTGRFCDSSVVITRVSSLPFCLQVPPDLSVSVTDVLPGRAQRGADLVPRDSSSLLPYSPSPVTTRDWTLPRGSSPTRPTWRTGIGVFRWESRTIRASLLAQSLSRDRLRFFGWNRLFYFFPLPRLEWRPCCTLRNPTFSGGLLVRGLSFPGS